MGPNHKFNVSEAFDYVEAMENGDSATLADIEDDVRAHDLDRDLDDIED